jgi:hypothetical protein
LFYEDGQEDHQGVGRNVREILRLEAIAREFPGNTASGEVSRLRSEEEHALLEKLELALAKNEMGRAGPRAPAQNVEGCRIRLVKNVGSDA